MSITYKQIIHKTIVCALFVTVAGYTLAYTALEERPSGIGTSSSGRTEDVSFLCSFSSPSSSSSVSISTIGTSLHTPAEEDSEEDTDSYIEAYKAYWAKQGLSAQKPLFSTIRSKTVFSVLKKGVSPLFIRTITDLIEQGVDHNEKDAEVNTLLHVAVKYKSDDSLFYCLLIARLCLMNVIEMVTPHYT